LDGFDAVGIGPGIGTSIETAKSVKQMIHNFKNPIVIGADAINILSENKSWLLNVPSNSIFISRNIN